MRKASLAFSLLLCLFLTLSCTQNDDLLFLEESMLEKKHDDLSETQKGTINVDDVKNVESCADAITNVNYHTTKGDLFEKIAITWSYVAPDCGPICPPPGLIEYDIEIQIGSIGTYGAFWGTIFPFSHVDSSTTSELFHEVALEDLGGRSQLMRFRVKLKSCSTFSEWVTSSTKFQ
jgi:hypothetical protein